MLTNNSVSYSLKILAEFGRDILYFPGWWYTRGLAMTVLKLIDFLRQREKSLALSVWVKNIFKPMFGQRDISGILISFFMRLFMIIARGLIMLFWVVVAISLLLIWILAPALVVYEIMFQML